MSFCSIPVSVFGKKVFSLRVVNGLLVPTTYNYSKKGLYLEAKIPDYSRAMYVYSTVEG